MGKWGLMGLRLEHRCLIWIDADGQHADTLCMLLGFSGGCEKSQQFRALFLIVEPTETPLHYRRVGIGYMESAPIRGPRPALARIELQGQNERALRWAFESSPLQTIYLV